LLDREAEENQWTKLKKLRKFGWIFRCRIAEKIDENTAEQTPAPKTAFMGAFAAVMFRSDAVGICRRRGTSAQDIPTLTRADSVCKIWKRLR
jgi:hypothetical protein